MNAAPLPVAGLRVAIVCEGQTEEAFVGQMLAPAFYSYRIVLQPLLIPTSPGHRGGALVYARVKRFLRKLLQNGDNFAVVTTLFDLYKLDKNFPDFHVATGKPLNQRLDIINKAFHADIVEEAGCQPERFVPYFQPYEFEALLFSDVTIVAGLETNWVTATSNLQKVRDEAESPEHINDGQYTKPAARFAQHLSSPSYNKTLHGPIAAELITLAKMESECKYFSAWLTSLRGLSSPVSPLPPT